MNRTRGKVTAALLVVLLTGGLVQAAPAFAAAPTITSFTPTSGKIYTPVTIVGTNFAAPATVKFDGVTAPATVVVNATRITTKVPLTAATGRISVTTAGGTGTSTSAFTVTPGLALSRTAGPPGSTVTVYYSGYGAFEAVDVYLDTNDLVLGTADADGVGNASVTIPSATAPGSHTITAVGRHSGYAAQAAFTVRTDWAQYGYVADHRASNTYENTLNAGNVANLEEAWRFESAGPGPRGTPAIVGGVVYAGFGDGFVRAFDEQTGTQKWSYATNFVVESSPAVVGGVVYVGSDDDSVYALNASTGALKWHYDTGGHVTSSPVVAGGMVYVGSQDGKVYALYAANGALAWSFDTGAPVTSSPAVSGSGVYVGSDNGHVYRLQDGFAYWDVNLGNSVESSPVVVGGRVYVGTDGGQFYSLATEDGGLKWTYTTGGAIYSGAAVAAGVVYVESADGKVYALLAASGAVKWTASAPNPMTGAPTISNGVLYATSEYRTYALAAASGLPLTTIDAGSSNGYVVVADGTLTFGETDDYVLVHYTLTGGRPPAGAARAAPRSLRPNPGLRP